MTVRLTNTLTGEQEPFEPADPDSVLLYYCGLTTSDPAHLGHARGWVVVDVLHRWLEHEGYGVRHVENFTDVNEKIVARVGEVGDSEPDVARHYVADILRDMRSLNLERAEVYPRVSEHVPEIIDLVETLVEEGYAYESNGSVYFDVTAFENYGALSNQDLSEIEEQGDPDERSEKRHPADFALWKAGGVDPDALEEHRNPDHPGFDDHPEGQTWDSPWGEGRPGWHIECSAMSTTHLGETLDVHVGGRDLVFPHHENEIAQSEAATGETFARHWMHVGMLQIPGDEEDEKMSSSLGNFTTVEAAVAEFGPNVVRTFLLSGAYGSPLSYGREAIDEAERRFDRLREAHRRAVEAVDSPEAATKVDDDALREAVDRAREEFAAAMNDDLNTREAIAALTDLAGAVNRHVDDREAYDYVGLRRAVEAFEDLGEGVLGFAFEGEATGGARLAEEAVELALSIREAEREAGNYDRADRIRDRLGELGVAVQDTDDGPEFRFE
ncbi:cysteine--tRNA ligase [Halobacteriales archaeon QS_8_69_26]|nr:MAG: cysteine--tRNA ligase [Halobacteriales archaeon QS_8_69_26]